MATLYNTKPTKKRLRIPRSRDVIYNPEYGDLTMELCLQNMNSLLNSFQAVFRSLVSVSVSFRPAYENPWGKYVATIIIHAINPKTKQPWHQSLEITTTGIISIDGGQRAAAWFWKFTYFQKCIRALQGWVKDIQENRLSKQRTQERNTQIKEQLIQTVFG